MSTPVVHVEGIEKRFGRKVHALRGIQLSVEPGCLFGLLGRNGAGKTTLVKILLDIVRPTSGNATLLGQPCRTKEARRRAGYLPEDHRFPDYQTPRRLLQFYGRLSEMDAGAIKRRTGELLERVDLTHATDRKVRGFSKGMKQRLGLAQALLHEPEVLFLDEPTDGIDPKGRSEVRELLLEERAKGRTIFINSHLLGEVEQMCDRVAIMEQGQLVKEGTVSSLTEAGLAYAVRFDRAPEESSVRALIAHCSALVPQAATDTVFDATFENESQLDAFLDTSRDLQLRVRELRLVRHSLESVFLQTLADGEAPALQESAR